jgi:hypothetical protein
MTLSGPFPHFTHSHPYRDLMSEEELRERWRQGTLALIGAAVRERGRRDGDEVVVELGAELIALAVDAGDDVTS